jgi:hypothetical protein
VTFKVDARLLADDDRGLLDPWITCSAGFCWRLDSLVLIDRKNDLIRLAKQLRDRIGPRLRAGAGGGR